MREILFAAKRVDDGEWVYWDTFGCVICMKSGGYAEIGEWDCGKMINDFEVIPETVSQSTGLTDKNGVKIFENYIVIIKYTDNLLEYQETRKVRYDEAECRYYPMAWGHFCDYCETECKINSIEVIGNIFDNPELLESEVTE